MRELVFKSFGLIWIFLLFWFPQNIQGEDNLLLKDCMETVKDVDKCHALVKRNKERKEADQNKAEKLTEEGKDLKIRKKIKNDLQGKNKLYVIKYLGEPDERQNGPDYELFIYKSPKSRYSEDSPIDKEITVIFRRGHVSEVRHTPPPEK